MSQRRFQNTRFYGSAGTLAQIPRDGRLHVLMAGKSNVGKSSLINRLCQQKKLARTASSPGKTRLLNFYLVDQDFYLVDLPGYGYSKASRREEEAFSELTDQYLSSGAPIALILHVIDARHLPSQEDLEMIYWLESWGVPYLLLLNKADKLKKSQRPREMREIRDCIEATFDLACPELFMVSAVTGEGIPELSGRILTEIDAH